MTRYKETYVQNNVYRRIRMHTLRLCPSIKTFSNKQLFIQVTRNPSFVGLRLKTVLNVKTSAKFLGVQLPTLSTSTFHRFAR